MNKLFQVVEFSKYLMKSKHWRGHGVHSPFMYDFVRNTLMSAHRQPGSADYLKILKELAPKKIGKSTLGTNSDSATIAFKKMLKRISISDQYGRLLNNIVKNYKPKQVLELGAGLGVSTYFLANQNPQTSVVTVEGVSHYASLAAACFERLKIENVSVVTSTFDGYLSSLNDQQFDLIFIDGSHNFESTISYFEKLLDYTNPDSIIIFDDIRWSPGMLSAWNSIKRDSRVKASVDLGRIGMIFLNPELQKQEYVIRYRFFS